MRDDPPTWIFVGTAQGVAVDDAQVQAGDFTMDGKTTLAVYDETLQHWYHGRFSGSQLVWEPIGDGRLFQAVENGPMLIAKSKSAGAETPGDGPPEKAEARAAAATPRAAQGQSWPVHAYRKDHVYCGDVSTDLFVNADGSVRGTMTLKGTCWLAGTHASMVALVTDANGAPLYVTPSLRLGVDPGRSVTVDLSNPRYNLKIPASVMNNARGVGLLQRYDPNDVRKIIGDIVAGVISVLWVLVIVFFI